jgi:hypothetical protein
VEPCVTRLCWDMCAELIIGGGGGKDPSMLKGAMFE